MAFRIRRIGKKYLCTMPARVGHALGGVVHQIVREYHTSPLEAMEVVAWLVKTDRAHIQLSPEGQWSIMGAALYPGPERF